MQSELQMRLARKRSGMAKLVFEMNLSLDGYVETMAFEPSPALFRHFIGVMRGLGDSVQKC